MKVYLDHAATTPLDKRVFKAMTPYLTSIFANPSSPHFYGRESQRGLDEARDSVAQVLGVTASAVYFTASGSEADNWAVKGGARAVRARTGKSTVLVSAIEHHAVLNSVNALKSEGFHIVTLPVLASGVLDMTALQNALTDDVALVCVMTANNEVGSVQPVADIATFAHSVGAYFFTDAVQAVGTEHLQKSIENADMVSLSAHKFYGPKCVGALIIKKGTPILPFIDGGEQERGLRGGTSNVAGAVGLSTALKIATDEQEENEKTVKELRDYFLNRVMDELDGVALNGELVGRLACNANLAFLGVDGTALLRRLDMSGVAVSLGSACTSGAIEPSHVLTAMGLDEKRAKSSIRFTFGKDNTREQVDYVIKTLKKTLCELK